MGEMINSYKLLVRKLEGKRPLRRPRHGWENNIRMNVRDMGGMMWTGHTWLGIGTSGGLLNLWISCKARNFLTS
jgi:hypothetical protein